MIIKDWTYSEQLKQTLKTIADGYEKEYPDKERGIKGVGERKRFLKRYKIRKKIINSLYMIKTGVLWARIEAVIQTEQHTSQKGERK